MINKKITLVGNDLEFIFDPTLVEKLTTIHIKGIVVLIPTETEPRLLVHSPHEIPYHALAVRKYMESNNLPSITINGGMHLSLAIRAEFIVIEKLSTAFGPVCEEELKSILQNIWPGYEIVFKDNQKWFYKPAERNIHADGKQYTYEEVKNEKG